MCVCVSVCYLMFSMFFSGVIGTSIDLDGCFLHGLRPRASTRSNVKSLGSVHHPYGSLESQEVGWDGREAGVCMCVCVCSPILALFMFTMLYFWGC